jgi:hypothetical protein
MPASPTQWLYGLYDFVLVTSFLAIIICFGFASADLTPAPGRRTQTISPYAHAALVSRSLRLHRSLSLVCDDGLRPLVGQDGDIAQLIWAAREAIYFWRCDWTTQITLYLLVKLTPTRAASGIASTLSRMIKNCR